MLRLIRHTRRFRVMVGGWPARVDGESRVKRQALFHYCGKARSETLSIPDTDVGFILLLKPRQLTHVIEHTAFIAFLVDEESTQSVEGKPKQEE